MNCSPYKAILFDLDGVLVDMPAGHYEALNKALALFGVRIDEDEHYKLFNGLPTKKKIDELERQGRLPAGLKDFLNEVKQNYTKELIPKYCPPDYSKIILLRHLKSQGYRLACCSNSVRETLHLMLRSAGLFDLFDLVLGNDEISQPKPHPEIYLTAFQRLGVQPGECIIVEDSPYGIAAAKASGATVYEVKGVNDVNLSLFERLSLPRGMSRHHLDQFTRGWIVGDFAPTILPLKEAELMVRSYRAGDREARHVHRMTHEITVIVTGIFKMNGVRLGPGDIVHLEPGTPADFECLEDGSNVAFKTPSVKGDKYPFPEETI